MLKVKVKHKVFLFKLTSIAGSSISSGSSKDGQTTDVVVLYLCFSSSTISEKDGHIVVSAVSVLDFPTAATTVVVLLVATIAEQCK